MNVEDSARRFSGFTLIEVVISAALAALILASSYMCLSAALSSRKLIEPRIDVLQSARVAMAIMGADLRSACPLSRDVQFLGMHRMLTEVPADNLDFGTHNYAPRRMGEGDFCQISFFVDKDVNSGEFVLWRRRNPVIGIDPLSGGSREEIARGIQGLRFEYYDGFDWYDTWGDTEGKGRARNSQRDQPNLYGMPEAVRITLMLDSKPHSKAPTSREDEKVEPPMVFQTVARLNMAAAGASQSSDSSSSPGGEAPVTTTATGPGANPN